MRLISSITIIIATNDFKFYFVTLVQIINGIVGADRIQSLLFLFRMEYPQVQAAAKATVQVVADTPDLKPSISKALAKYIVLLGE